jgi:hypothetical protein
VTDEADDPLVVEAESVAPGPAGPGTASPDRGSEEHLIDDSSSGSQPRRRPRSLRNDRTSSGEAAFRGVSAPQFPYAEREPTQQWRPIEPLGSASGPATPPYEPVMPGPDPGPSALEQLTKLINERPEVSIGLAFVGGVILASILNRLAR